MNCFQHRAIAAIGLCKSCGKGLCADCAAEVPNGLACRDRCEGRVRSINEMLDRNARVANSQMRSTAAFVLLMGLGLLTFALLEYEGGHVGVALFCGMFGAFFVLFGLTRLVAKRLPEIQPQTVSEKDADVFARQPSH